MGKHQQHQLCIVCTIRDSAQALRIHVLNPLKHPPSTTYTPRATNLTNSSNTRSCTMKRSAPMQFWPLHWNAPRSAVGSTCGQAGGAATASRWTPVQQHHHQRSLVWVVSPHSNAPLLWKTTSTHLVEVGVVTDNERILAPQL